MVITRARKIPGPSYAFLNARYRDPPIERFRKTKTYLRALVKGVSPLEAKKLSGLPQSLSTRQIMEQSGSQFILQELLKEEEFRDTGLAKRLKQMWHHKKTTVIQKDGITLPIHEDDTDMWKYSMDKVLKLRGYLKPDKEDLEKSNNTVIGIAFNVLQLPNEKAV